MPTCPTCGGHLQLSIGPDGRPYLICSGLGHYHSEPE